MRATMPQSLYRLTAGLLVTILLAGCAGYSVRDEATGREGYVVYEPWPYVLMSEVKDGYKFEVVYLPNRSRPFRVRSWAGFGKADFEFTFEQGWKFTGLKDKSENTAVLEAMSGLLTPLITAKALAPGEPKVEQPKVFLYRLDFDNCGRVCGLTPVTASPPAPPS